MRRRPLPLVLVGLLTLLLAYPIAALIGGALPTNRSWQAPEDGVTLFIESNGIHTGLILPKVAAGVDWRSIFPGKDLRDPRYGAYDHLSIGWGDRDFYLNTPTWADINLPTVTTAAIGSNRTMLHVDHLPRPDADGSVRRLVMRPAEYRRLAAYIQASLVTGGERRHGYYAYDAFYTARGRYSALRTCNGWVGDALRFAGIRVGAWTPLPLTVMWWFPRHE